MELGVWNWELFAWARSFSKIKIRPRFSLRRRLFAAISLLYRARFPDRLRGMVVLKTSKLFGGLLAAELEALEQTAQIKAYKAGRNIFQEGDPGDGLYLILEGKVQITCLLGQDQRIVLSRLDDGDFFGEMAVLDNQPRSATATAETDAKVYFILRDDLLKVLECSPRLAASLVKEFSQRMRDFNHQYTREVLQAERLALVGRFARSIVHDLKNPLNIIGISAELAAMDNATLEVRRAAKDRIRKQIDRLSDMINELLEFTRGSARLEPSRGTRMRLGAGAGSGSDMTNLLGCSWARLADGRLDGSEDGPDHGAVGRRTSGMSPNAGRRVAGYRRRCALPAPSAPGVPHPRRRPPR